VSGGRGEEIRLIYKKYGGYSSTKVAYFFSFITYINHTSIIVYNRFSLHLRQTCSYAMLLQTRYRGWRMAGEERQRENAWVCGNVDICQEIDNSNKLVAKHSNRLPNGTIVHSNPRLRTKHRTSPPMPTVVHGSDVRARAIQCAYYLLDSPRTSELITDRFAERFYFKS